MRGRSPRQPALAEATYTENRVADAHGASRDNEATPRGRPADRSATCGPAAGRAVGRGESRATGLMSVRPIGGAWWGGAERGEGRTAREIPPQSKGGRRCVAVTSDSRASCRRRHRRRRRRRYTDGVFYDRVAAALQGLGGRALETPRSFLVAMRTKQRLRETYLLHVPAFTPSSL